MKWAPKQSLGEKLSMTSKRLRSTELQQLYCTYMKTILTMQVYVFVTVILSHVANAIAYFDTEC